MPLSAPDVMSFLYIVVAAMLIVVLYHVMFIVVDLRKILRRLDHLTEEVEAVIMKPIGMVDQILKWVIERIEQKKKHTKHGAVSVQRE